MTPKFKAGDPVWVYAQASDLLLPNTLKPPGKYAAIVRGLSAPLPIDLMGMPRYELEVFGNQHERCLALEYILEPRHDGDGALRVIEWLADDLAEKEKV